MTAGRASARLPAALWAGLAGAALLVLAPVAALLSSVLRPETDVWAHLAATRLPGMAVATAVLVAVVSVASAVLGTALAWLVAVHRFPGRNALVWMLALPLAIPAYVSGFVWVDTLGVRTLAMAAVVLTLSLYPYVYVLALAAFRDQPAGAWNSARTLGCRPGEAFRRVALPAARPAVLAGTVLVALEVLTDVGTVRLFNVQTVADGVFRVWFGLAQREAATELAGLLLLAAAALLLAERRAGRRAGAGPVAGGRDLRRVEPAPLTGSGWLGVAGAVVVVGAALVFPLVRLASWAAEAVGRGATASAAGGLGHHLGSTLRVTAATVLVCTAVGVVVALATRWVRGRGTRTLATVTTLGYGLPGPVIALGVLVVLAAVDRTGWLPRGTLLVGSFLGLVAALVVRYLALAVKPAEQAVGRVGRSAEDAARMLGAGPGRVVGRVQLPLARGGLAVAAALVALDVVKELPATLLLRPFGVDTLPVWVWQASSDSRWAEAGLPSLVLVLVAAVPTAVLLRSMLRGRAVAW